MRVAMLQVDIKEGVVDWNFDHVTSWIEEAMKEQPDILVLPEMWNTGYALDRLEELADPDGERTKKVISRLATEYQVTILAGSVATKKGGDFYNTSYVFGPDGSLLSEYDKVHLFGLMAEDQFISAGEAVGEFVAGDVQSSHVICYDIRFPEWLRTTMSHGSQVLFVSAQWPDVRIPQWRILLQARAVENQAFVVAVNRVGSGGKDRFNGHSLVIDPLGTVLVEAGETEGVFTADLDLTQVDQVRGQIPVFADRRVDLYQ